MLHPSNIFTIFQVSFRIPIKVRLGLGLVLVLILQYCTDHCTGEKFMEVSCCPMRGDAQEDLHLSLSITIIYCKCPPCVVAVLFYGAHESTDVLIMLLFV